LLIGFHPPSRGVPVLRRRVHASWGLLRSLRRHAIPQPGAAWLAAWYHAFV
jgi:hypothetical protein